VKNKYIYIIIILLLGILLTVFGALLKIMHFEIGFFTGNIVLMIGMLLKVIALFLFIVKLISNKNDSFLNK
jgi:hypothetical protein